MNCFGPLVFMFVVSCAALWLCTDAYDAKIKMLIARFVAAVDKITGKR